MPPQPDFTVRIVDDAGEADSTVAVIDGITELSPSSGDLLQYDGARWTNVATVEQSRVSGLTAALAAKANDNAVVHLTGNETIAGNKTLSGATTLSAALTLSDVNVVLGTTTGTKIGTATNQKLGFFNATPVVQPAGTTDVLASLVTLGLRAASSNPPLDLGTGQITAGIVRGGAGNNGFSIGSDSGQFRIDTAGSAGTEYRFMNSSNGFAGIKAAASNFTSTVTLDNSANLSFGTGAGTIIAQNSSQKMGFWGATPVVRPTGVAVTAAGIHAALVTIGLIAA